MLYLALNPGGHFGWGICSKYLIREISRLTKVDVIDDSRIKGVREASFPGSVFHAIRDHSLQRQYPIRGIRNYGYTFFENVLEYDAPANAGFYDLIFAGSTWCKERLNDKGIWRVKRLIQGVDPEMFFPVEFEKPSGKDKFIIFSGGKLELRKGQDLVLKAVKVLQEKYEDIVLMCLWHNPWLYSLETMRKSPHIEFSIRGQNWEEVVKNIMADNGLDPERNIVLPPIRNEQLRNVYANTDIGVFPNRCEGGTNLVLMEYMACSKPVIASYSSGHRDILTEDNALLLNEMKPFRLFDEHGNLVADWEEPEIDELISKLEYAYLNMHKLGRFGKQGGEDMKGFSWRAMAEDLVGKIGETGGGF